ncbi:MAG TPA: M24 family metallopeptidase [Ignavibacteriaceae bacterium]|nr:M24 family metallopeptidase [Ignavibacteriaceae bacterium]
MSNIKINKIQQILIKLELDGWLMYDFRGNNNLALNILKIPKGKISSRRFFYLIPAKGTPVKIVNGIEANNLDHLPGKKLIYTSHNSLSKCLIKALTGHKSVAMEYSPKNSIPYVSKIDAGSIELIRSFGVKVFSSSELISRFDSIWSRTQFNDNKLVSKALTDTVAKAFKFCKNRLLNGKSLTEYDIQQFINSRLQKANFITNHPAIAAINSNSANPHYAPTQKVNRKIKKGDFLLLDLWAKVDKPNGVWGDITWVGYLGETVPRRYANIFNIVAEARDAAFNLVNDRFTHGREITGYEVDDAARNVIKKAGYGDYFIHRTGHSITTEGHGSGAHMDNYETHDDRLILPSTSFSIEPGIYLPGKFGIRSEIDVFIRSNGKVIATGEVQKEIIAVLK